MGRALYTMCPLHCRALVSCDKDGDDHCRALVSSDRDGDDTLLNGCIVRF